MLMRPHMKMDTPQHQAVTRRMSVFPVLFTATFLIFSARSAEAAAANPVRKVHWVSSGKGSLRCVGSDGKTVLKYTKGIPTYESEVSPISSDYRSANFLVFDKGRSAVVFDFSIAGTTATFYIGGCAPTKTYFYPKLEVYRYTHILKSGAGLVAALSNINVDAVEGFDYSGYIIQWDSSGAEKMKSGPQEIGRMYTQDIEMFDNDKYGALGLGTRILFFNFVKAKDHLYQWPEDGRGGKYEFTPEGTLQIFQIVSWKTKDGEILPNDGSLKRLPPDEYDRVSRTISPVYQLVHEYQF